MLARTLLALAIIAPPEVALAGPPTSPYPASIATSVASPSRVSRASSQVNGEDPRVELRCGPTGPHNVMVCFRSSRRTPKPTATPPSAR